MAAVETQRLSRDDWLKAAFDMCEGSIERIKVAPLAKQIGVTTGSFYWHFRNRGELLDALLAYWEKETTDSIIQFYTHDESEPLERIYNLLELTHVNEFGSYELAVRLWAQTDDKVRDVYARTVAKRLDFAADLFRDAGFSDEQATLRGYMLIAYTAGEAAQVPGPLRRGKEGLREKFEILTKP